MAALTLEQLRERSRAKFPVTVVKDEDYTVLTPAQIAAAWTGYSGGTVGVRLKDTDDIWYAMDADLPKANGRGLLVFGGGKQYALRCDFADCTVGQAAPGSWLRNLNGLTSATVIAKDEQYGLPYVDVEFVGTPTLNWSFANQQSVHLLSAAEFVNGDLLVCRSMIDVLSLPASVSQIEAQLNDELNTKYTHVVMSLTTGLKETEATFSVDLGETTHECYTPKATHTASVELSPSLQYRYFPFLYSINTAFPSHFHCINTSTTTAATIVPEILQRPWEYEGPWSVELEFTTPPRTLANHLRFLHLGSAADNVSLYWNTAGYVLFKQVIGGVDKGSVQTKVVAVNTTAKVVLYQTAQTTRIFVDGTEYSSMAYGRSVANIETLGAYYDGTKNSFATFKSYKYRRGLATDAQLEEWSTAA